MSEIEHPRRRVARLQGYDYSSYGGYFITVCAHERQCLFGDVRGGETVLSRIGRIIDEAWREIPDHFPGVTLDEFVIMPNHIHGILFLTGGQQGQPAAPDKTDTACRVPTHGFGAPVKASIPVVVGAFKAAVTRRVREMMVGPCTIWQRRYHEHIIRDDEDLYNIRRYIQNNPAQWELDRENPHHS